MIRCENCNTEFISFKGHSLCPKCYNIKLKYSNQTRDFTKFMWHHNRNNEGKTYKDSTLNETNVGFVLYGNNKND